MRRLPRRFSLAGFRRMRASGRIWRRRASRTRMISVEWCTSTPSGKPGRRSAFATGLTSAKHKKCWDIPDPSLTARAYTDIAALALDPEIAKLPWISRAEKSTQRGTQKSGNQGHLASLRVIEGQLHEIPQVTVDGVLSPFLTLSGTSGQRREMVVGTGFEPV
jgi:hypothetical protein